MGFPSRERKINRVREYGPRLRKGLFRVGISILRENKLLAINNMANYNLIFNIYFNKLI